MSDHRLALGLDVSTKYITAVLVDIDQRIRVSELSLDFAKDPRLNGFGITNNEYVVPPRIEGEADQPPKMYFTAIDAIFGDMKAAGYALEDIVVCNGSGQPHTHIYLNQSAESAFYRLKKQGTGEHDLLTLLEGCMSYGLAPTWMTSNTVMQSDYIRSFLGGKDRVIRLSGSNAPLRFTGLIIRRVAEQYPEVYRQTENVLLLSNLVTAILTGNSKVPIDYGSAAGTSLMNYTNKEWSDDLIRATSRGLQGGEITLRCKLPVISAPDRITGNIATYFVEKYGMNPDCKIVVGADCNAQSKVTVTGDLLRLGSNIVNMVTTDGTVLDMGGTANASYDGTGKPFILGYRTNGTSVWDKVRAYHGLQKDQFGPAEVSLQRAPLAHYLAFWQPQNETFPPSGKYDLIRVSHGEDNLEADYAGLIESTLATIHKYTKEFSTEYMEPLYVTGSAAESPGIVRRIAAIWNRQVVPLAESGAALGAAIAGAYAYLNSNKEEIEIDELNESLVKRREIVSPRPEDVSAYHNPDGYLDRFDVIETRIIKTHPMKIDRDKMGF